VSLRTEKKLLDFGKWWEYHSKGTDDKGAIVTKLPENIDKRTTLLCDAVENLAHIYIDIVEDLRVLEGRGIIGRNVPKIITPDNMLKRNYG